MCTLENSKWALWMIRVEVVLFFFIGLLNAQHEWGLVDNQKTMTLESFLRVHHLAFSKPIEMS